MNKSSHRILKISQNPQENTCDGDSFIIKLQVKACNFIKKETLAQVFSCEFCGIFKNTFFYVTPLVTASVRESLKNWNLADSNTNYNCNHENLPDEF